MRLLLVLLLGYFAQGQMICNMTNPDQVECRKGDTQFVFVAERALAQVSGELERHAGNRPTTPHTLTIAGEHPPLPDLSMTPGAVRTSERDAICNLRSTKDIRYVKQSQKKAIYAEYHTAPGKGVCQLREHITKKGRKIQEGCEVDHLISLELGGANDTTNLWPQPYHPRPGAHEKDWLENRLHKEICAGRISVKDAQEGIVKDWWMLYQKYKK